MAISPWVFSFLIFWSNICDIYNIDYDVGDCEKYPWFNVSGKYINRPEVTDYNFKIFRHAERTCQDWNGHLLQLYPISDIESILSVIWGHEHCRENEDPLLMWLGVKGFSNKSPVWVDGTKMEVKEYINYIDIKSIESGHDCIQASVCELGPPLWQVTKCSNNSRYITCESKDPCGVRAGMMIGKRDVWKDNIARIRETELLELSCLSRGHNLDEQVANVTLNCPENNGGNGDTLVNRFLVKAYITFSLESHGKKCVCKATRLDGTNDYFELMIEFEIGPRPENVDTSSDSKIVNATAISVDRSVSGLEGESAAFDFVVLANPKPYRCTLRKEPSWTIVSFEKYNWTIEELNTPLRLKMTIIFIDLEFNQTGTYRVIIENGIEPYRELRLALRVIAKKRRPARVFNKSFNTSASLLGHIIQPTFVVFFAIMFTIWYKKNGKKYHDTDTEEEEEKVEEEETNDDESENEGAGDDEENEEAGGNAV